MGGEDLLVIPPEPAEPTPLAETPTGELRRALLRRLSPEEPAS